MYESEQTTLSDSLGNGTGDVFTSDTIARILELSTKTDNTATVENVSVDAQGLVTVGAGVEVVFVTSPDAQQTLVTPPANTPVVIFQGLGGVNVTFNDGPSTVPAHAAGVTDRVVVGSSGNDRIVVADAKNTQITLGSGDSTVVAGAGEDTIVAGLGNSTVSGGTGHAIVQLKGNAADYQVTVVNGHAVVTGGADATSTDITKIQYVQLDAGKALVFADDTEQAAITTLYETAFGRTAESGGLQHWFDRAAAGESLRDIADDFTESSEFTPQAGLNDSDFINGLYLHTFGRQGEADGVAFWQAALHNGATRGQLIASFSEVASQNIDQTLHTEPIVIGSVTIIHDII